ncbi:MAG: FliO/MopB family protein [Candidatus Saccharimonadales bacterium]
MNLYFSAARHRTLFAFCVASISLPLIAPHTLAAEGAMHQQQASQPPRPSRSGVESASFERPINTGDADRAARGGVPLPPRGQPRGGNAESDRLSRPAATASTLLTGAASFAVVLGLFFVVAWALRRGMPRGAMLLPSDVVEVLGRAPLSSRQFAHLVRCGNKLLLVHLAAGCAETLTEITDPVEVDRLAGLCKQAHPQSTTASFRHVFQQVSREKPEEGAKRASARFADSRHQLPVDSVSEDADA